MKKLRIGIIDIVSRGPTRALYTRIMNASLASIMPQVTGVWCKEEGHEVTFVCYTGFEDLLAELRTRIVSSKEGACMIAASQLRVGMAIRHKGDTYKVIAAE